MLVEQQLESGITIWVAEPPSGGLHPAIVVMHERYGPVQHPKDLVQRFANEGFVAVLRDMFLRYTGDRRAIERGEARCEPTDKTSLVDLDDLMAWLKRQSYIVDDDEIGIMGICHTGREPLLYAAHRSDVAAIVILNGGVYPRKSSLLMTTQPCQISASTRSAAWATIIRFLRETLGGDGDRSRVIWHFESETSPEYDCSKNPRL